MSFVYILEGKRNGKYYVGSTENLERRMLHHVNGHTPTTKRFGGIKLVFKQYYDNIGDARKIEKKLKKMKRKDYLIKIVKDGYIKIKS